MPDAGILATLLLLVGLFLLGLEFFVPSFGMILFVAVVSLIVSFWSACKAWWGVNPAFFWMYVAMLVAGIPGSLLGAIALMQKTSLGNRLILRPPSADQNPAPNPLDELIGQHGIAQTLLTPGGMVSVQSERYHAESLGMLIEPKTPVIVIGTRANRIVVRPWTAADENPAQQLADEIVPPAERMAVSPPGSSQKNRPEFERAAADEGSDRLDFEIPEDYTQSPGS